MVRELKQGRLPVQRHLNRTEAELKGEVTEQVHQCLQILVEVIVSAPNRVIHRLRNRGEDSRTGSLPSKEGTLLALVIILTKSLSGDVSTDKKGKGETLIMDNQGPTTKGVRLKGGCNLHILGVEGGLLEMEILGLVGKHHIRGKTRGKTRSKIWDKLRGVIIVITRGGVIGVLVPP